MNNSESAETLVKMTIDGVKVAAQLSGTGMKNIAVILYSIINDQKKTRGKTTLKKMLKNHPNIKIFSLNNQDLKKFQEEAKRYGVLYSALIDRVNPNGPKDIFIRAEDAPKVNRIIDKDEIHSDLDDLINEILEKPNQKEENTQSNPSMGQTKEKGLSENSSKKQKSKVEISKIRPSVRKMIKEIKEELKEKQEVKEKSPKQREIKHKQPERKKKYKSKGR